MKTMDLYLYFEKREVVSGYQVVPGMLGLKIRLLGQRLPYGMNLIVIQVLEDKQWWSCTLPTI